MAKSDDELTTTLTDGLGAGTAKSLMSRLTRYTNSPGAIKGMAKWPADPHLESALAVMLADPASVEGLGLKVLGDPWQKIYQLPPGVPKADPKFWGLVTLAARADLTRVEQVVAPMGEHGNAERLLADVRKATAAHAKALAAPPPVASAAPTTPQKVSEVKAWLAAHPGFDPTELAPHPGQKAASRVAAVRALGTLGTPQALAVLGEYAAPNHSEPMLKELHTAWSNYDRDEFAAEMFRPDHQALDLRQTPDLAGIGAIADLTSLTVALPGSVSLTPLTQAVQLQALSILLLAGSIDLTPLATLPQLTRLRLIERTQLTELAPLAGLRLRTLELTLHDHDPDLLRAMPALQTLDLLAYRHPDRQGNLAAVALDLAGRGVRVTVHHGNQGWVTDLVGRAQADPRVQIVAGPQRHILTRVNS